LEAWVYGGENRFKMPSKTKKYCEKNCPKETAVCGSYILKGGFIPPLVMIWSSENFPIKNRRFR
jgi:hypothetical protein